MQLDTYLGSMFYLFFSLQKIYRCYNVDMVRTNPNQIVFNASALKVIWFVLTDNSKNLST